jgi:seryl-tRNA synthetase
MLDPRYFKENIAELEAGLKKRNVSPEIVSRIASLAKSRRDQIVETEGLKAKRNAVTQEIAQLKSKAKSDPAAAAEADKKVVAMRAVGDQIKALDEQLKKAEEDLQAIALTLPNLPHPSVPEGKDEHGNVEVRKWGEKKSFSFQPLDHVALGEKLGILDFERASRMSGARFVVTSGAGARLERALGQFMLDLHTSQHGYTEVNPPLLVNRAAMTGTGQLPKFEEDLFKTGVGADRELFLIPTAEVSLTNIHREELIEAGRLPYYYTGLTACFRSEAGAYGKDTRGMIRQHQFYKVELVKIVQAETSYEELEKMVSNAEKVLQLLEIPYRVMQLCSGDMGFSAAKTYDIEAWMPAQDTFREISSCSNCEDFQARRASISYRPEPQAKPRLAHTLNGSGLPIGRTFVAILENYQDKDGNIEVPKVLEKYVTGAKGFTEENNRLWIKAQR